MRRDFLIDYFDYWIEDTLISFDIIILQVHFSSEKDDVSLYGTPKEELVPGSAASLGTDASFRYAQL